MKLGTNEPKKVALLAVLAAGAGYLVYSNVLSGPSAPKPAVRPAAAQAPAEPAAAAPAESVRTTARVGSGRARSDEFRPVLHSKRPEDRINPDAVDPTLRLDLLAKLQQVPVPASGRNLFQAGQPPAKPEALKGAEPKIALSKPAAEVKPEPPKPAGPPPPPLPFKYYGYSSTLANSAKTAFFLDGDDILIAKEGEMLKRRYRVVRIGVNSVVMEDTESKRQQTIPLAEEAG